jgi:peptidoglycan-associated lipoprotein
VPGTGCEPKNDVGGPCASNSDCNTDNCSPLQGICRTPIGEACTTDNCDRCLSSGSFTFCSRRCTSASDCNGSECLGDSIAQIYYCTPACTAACSGACQYTSDFSTQYCALDFTVSIPPGAYGYPCGGGPGCTSGTCFSASSQDVCSKSCATSADCGDGFACAALPCTQADAGAQTCGVCLATCSTDAGACRVGLCNSVPTTDGASAMMCDLRASAGSSCYANTDCVSERCAAGRCVAAGGASNGGACQTNGDCMSGNCAAGVCKGTALVGGACTTSADCSVGTCCSSGASANTCETGC